MKSHTSWQRILFQYSPVFICIMIMLPRLFSAQFGLFDDGRTLTTSRQIMAGTWDMQADITDGRFRPVYWLYNALLYSIFGESPAGFFIGNLLLLIFITIVIIRLSVSFGLSPIATWLTGTTFALSGPLWENIYTLSKPELLQLALICFLLLICGQYIQSGSPWRRVGWFLLATVIAFASCAAKETGLLLLPISLVCWSITVFFHSHGRLVDSLALTRRKVLLLTTIAGIMLYLTLRYFYLPTSLISGSYAHNFDFGLSWITNQARIWADILLRDFLYLIPLGFAALFSMSRLENRHRLSLLLECMVWMVVWFIVYIPWVFTQEYYLLPVTLGSALLSGLLFDITMELVHQKSFRQWIAWPALVLSMFILLATLPNFFTNAHLQLVIDRANWDMLNLAALKVPQNGKLWINYQAENEYTKNIAFWLNKMLNRSDIQIEIYAFQDPPPSGNVWIISPILENQFYPSVRMGVFQAETNQANASLEQNLGGRLESVAIVRYQFRLLNFDVLRFFCPLKPDIGYCDTPAAPLDHRQLAYGWKIDRLR